MMLRRITLERYGCFGSAEFEFRPGMNLISGGNDSGKTLLLTALPAALFGVEYGSRLRSWGDMLCCRVTLLFEDETRGVRLTRDLESNLVRLEERGPDGAWQDCFVGMAPPVCGVAKRGEYQAHLARVFDVEGEPLLRALLDPLQTDAVLAADGRLAEGLWAVADQAGTGGATSIPAATADARGQEIAILEAELADDRCEYQRGLEYLAWIRKRWQLVEGKGQGHVKLPATKVAAVGQEEQQRQRDQLLAELRQQGLPARLPDELPAMFAAAEGLRQELATLQLELTPLQRRKQAVVMPGIVWPLAVTLVGVVAATAAWWWGHAWSPWLAAGCAAVALLGWGSYLLGLHRARTTLAGLDKELRAVEAKRADALDRQHELAERFEACGLPSAPVEMVKLQQLCRRHEELISRYRQLCAQLGDEGATLPGAAQSVVADKHLRPEELPEAEARLNAMGESLRVREARLQQLRAEVPANAANTSQARVTSLDPGQRLLAVIGLHLERLSGGRYHEVRLEEGCLRLAIAPGRWAPPVACSRSAATCLTLAVRMALAEVAGCWLPLLVDDLALLLDQKRRQAAIRSLERFSRDGQVLLASGDEELAKRAIKEKWQVIRLGVPHQLSTPPGENANAGQLHLL
jgi:hypothetical protein